MDLDVCIAARDHMMMRYANISPEGDYTPPPPANAKAAYATMVYVRATIVEDAGWILARATTIAVRNMLATLTQHCIAEHKWLHAWCSEYALHS